MKVRLIDIDSTIPNLALMQLSSWHKSLGDEVGFDTPDPDRVYISCIFQENAALARGVATLFPSAEIILGGSGIDLHTEIPAPAQKKKPDYSLYPESRYSLGFTTRGCIRHCPFCVVPEKEGRLHRWMHIRDFYNPEYKTVKLLDNNIGADRDWFFENTNFLIEHDLRVNICGGMDIRILTEEIAQQLTQLKFVNDIINFAWDNVEDEEKIFAGIDILKDAGMPLHKVSFYVLTGYNSTFEQDKYRCQKLREAGVFCFVMQYQPNPQTRQLARWANRRAIYKSVPFADYNPHNRRTKT